MDLIRYKCHEGLVTGLGRFKLSWGNFYGWIDRKNGLKL